MKKTMSQSWPGVLLVVGCLLLAPAHAPGQAEQKHNERTSYFRNIVVKKGETIPVAVCILCSITVRGTVVGEAVVLWGNVEVEGRVEGEAVVLGGSVLLRENGLVEGEAVTVGGRVVRSGNGTVKGDVSEVPYVYLPGQSRPVFPGTLFFVIGNVMLSMVYLAAGRARVESLANTLQKWTILSFVIGAVAMAAMMYAFLWAADLDEYDSEMMATAGIMLTLLVAPGCAGVSLTVGRRLRRSASVAAAVFAGAVFLALLSLVPLLGLLLFGIVWVFALGATFVGRFGFARKSVAPQVTSSR